MVFVTVDENRAQLENLTKLLIRIFHGSVIYQYTDPIPAVINMGNREIDAVFVNVSVSQRNNWQLLALLRRKRPDLRVFILSDDEKLRENAMEQGAWEYLIRPVTGKELRDVISAETGERMTLYAVQAKIPSQPAAH